ncbi:MAG: hypothetical protein FJ267_07045 [Planctomycetes bacterium]|nr:hypothetical protein [Planctomycetota bacterium]
MKHHIYGIRGNGPCSPRSQIEGRIETKKSCPAGRTYDVPFDFKSRGGLELEVMDDEKSLGSPSLQFIGINAIYYSPSLKSSFPFV